MKGKLKFANIKTRAYNAVFMNNNKCEYVSIN